MTKKHYEAIAVILAKYQSAPLYELDYSDYRTAEHIANELSDYFATENPKFDRARFLQACGIVHCSGKHKTVTELSNCSECSLYFEKDMSQT